MHDETFSDEIQVYYFFYLSEQSLQSNQVILCILAASLCLSAMLQEKKSDLRNHRNYSPDSLCELSGDWSKHRSLLIRVIAQILHSGKEGQAHLQESEGLEWEVNKPELQWT